jgi:phage terminase large subunit
MAWAYERSKLLQRSGGKARKAYEIDYVPRSQFVAFHDRPQRWATISAHRRSGKTVAAINDLLRAAVRDGKKDGRYAYIGPLLNQVKDVAWGAT